MGKVSGLLSTAIFVGLVVVLFYLCCRVKRKPGTVVQRSALDFNSTPIQPVTPTPGLSGYPTQTYPHQPQVHQVYAPTTCETSGQQANGMANLNFYNYNAGYPSYPTNPPYPTNPVMPMPTVPMTNHSTQYNEHVQQGSAPSYPSASAPMEDLPPPYEAVVRQFK